MAEIKQYRKSELALMYFPECETKEGALSNLKSWIKGNKKLTSELKKCGMPPRKKSFTPKEVALIFKYLGDP
jgi:hypothetical protein